MIMISHRGNTSGKNTELENKSHYIERAIAMGYDVEIDVWCSDGKLFLGHDSAEEPIEDAWFHNKPLWCHCKNYQALKHLTRLGVHCFFHDRDDYTLTSQGFIWAYPGQPGDEKTIAVMPPAGFDVSNFHGVCSDNISDYRKSSDD